MVWDYKRSTNTFYSNINRLNERECVCAPPKPDDSDCEKKSEEKPLYCKEEFIPEDDCSCRKEKCRCDFGGKSENRCPRCGKAHICEKRQANTPLFLKKDLFSEILNDKDKLLILGLLILLIKEKSNMNLILALAYVLLT